MPRIKPRLPRPPSGEAGGGFWLSEAELDRRDEAWQQHGLAFPGLVTKNPEPDFLVMTALESSGAGVRGLLLGGDLLWWACELGTHGDACRWLGLGFRHSRIIDPARRHDEVEFHLRYAEFDRRKTRVLGSYLTADSDEGLARLLNHPSIEPHLDKDREGLAVDSKGRLIARGKVSPRLPIREQGQ